MTLVFYVTTEQFNYDPKSLRYLKTCLKEGYPVSYKKLILSNSQCGFRRNRSTLTALVEMTEKILSSFDAECSTIAIFIGLKNI